MKVWQAHLALAHDIGDPVSITGSPVVTIPNGVRYSTRLRNVYLYRAMLDFLSETKQQLLALPKYDADAVLQRMFPTFMVEDSLGPVNAAEQTLTLSRRPFWMLSVHTDGTSRENIWRMEVPGRFNAYAGYQNDVGHDPLYTLVPGTPGRIRMRVGPGYILDHSFDSVKVLYVPYCLDPADQDPEDELDLEPAYHEKVIARAAIYAFKASQDYQTAEGILAATGGQ